MSTTKDKNIIKFKPKAADEEMLTVLGCPKCGNVYLLVCVSQVYICEECDIQVLPPVADNIDFMPDKV